VKVERPLQCRQHAGTKNSLQIVSFVKTKDSLLQTNASLRSSKIAHLTKECIFAIVLMTDFLLRLRVMQEFVLPFPMDFMRPFHTLHEIVQHSRVARIPLSISFFFKVLVSRSRVQRQAFGMQTAKSLKDQM
jgi:hypothetical protein